MRSLATIVLCILAINAEVHSKQENDNGAGPVEWVFEISNNTFIQGGLDKQENPRWVLVDLELNAEASLSLDNDISIFSGGKLGAAYDAIVREHELEEVYLGIEALGYRAGFGRKEYATENFGLDVDVDLGRETDLEQVKERGRNVFFVEREFDRGEISFSTDVSNHAKSYDFYAQFELSNGFQIASAYQRHEETQGEVTNTTAISLSQQWASWQAHYTLANNERQTGFDISLEKAWQGGHNFAVSCGLQDHKAEDRLDTICFTNYSHSLSKYFYLNFEVAYIDFESSKNFGYLMGLEFEFE